MDKLGSQRKLQLCTAIQRDELSSTLYSRTLLTVSYYFIASI